MLPELPPEVPVELDEDDELPADEEDESDEDDVLDFPSVAPDEVLLDSDFIAFLRDSDG